MTDSGRSKQRGILITAVTVLVCVGIGFLIAWAAGWLPKTEVPSEQQQSQKSFDGSSEELRQTVIVPTLDTPIPQGKSGIWCASFQIAWNRLKDDVAKGPVQVENAQNIADRLNRASQSEADLPADSYYAAAGLVQDGILERIQAEMAHRFPNAPKPSFHEIKHAVVAYGFLQEELSFPDPFVEESGGFRFKDAAGNEDRVRGFGVPERLGEQAAARRQVQILYRVAGGSGFALDLSKDSQPSQVVLANIDRKQTLEEMLTHVREKVRSGNPLALERDDSLVVPCMDWRIQHHFRELEGEDKQLLNPLLQGLYMAEASQILQFQLNERGVKLQSQASLGGDWDGPSHYHFDRPFLLYLQKRGGGSPFFVMWVDNAELLIKWRPKPR